MDGDTCVAIIYQITIDKQHPEKEGSRQYRFQMSNNLGSVTIELDMEAKLISYEEYFPYGGTAIITGVNQAEVKLKFYRYAGKERDDSTGLYYYGARYYLPWMGRWLKPDPAGTVDGLNLYAFVGGNPISTVDPTGMAAESVDVVRAYNDLVLKAPSGAHTLTVGSDDYYLPRMSGELVAFVGQTTGVGSYMTSDPSKKPTSLELAVGGGYVYDESPSGRSGASGKLRANTQFAIKVLEGRATQTSTSGMNNQAQHVVPYSKLHESSVVKLYKANSEHPFNSQLLPNRTQFDTEMSGVLSTWSSGSSSGGVFTVPSGQDYSSLTGSFHQGYHSGYNIGMSDAIDTVAATLATTNGGVVTGAMMEAAIFQVQAGGRDYAQQLYPIYTSYKPVGGTLIFPHFSSSDTMEITSMAGQSTSKDRNQKLGGFVSGKVQNHFF